MKKKCHFLTEKKYPLTTDTRTHGYMLRWFPIHVHKPTLSLSLAPSSCSSLSLSHSLSSSLFLSELTITLPSHFFCPHSHFRFSFLLSLFLSLPNLSLLRSLPPSLSQTHVLSFALSPSMCSLSLPSLDMLVRFVFVYIYIYFLPYAHAYIIG